MMENEPLHEENSNESHPASVIGLYLKLEALIESYSLPIDKEIEDIKAEVAGKTLAMQILIDEMKGFNERAKGASEEQADELVKEFKQMSEKQYQLSNELLELSKRNLELQQAKAEIYKKPEVLGLSQEIEARSAFFNKKPGAN